ncbi:hypothetical protein HDU97_001488 [Phlyctochytrium planicorne]|nr:hypothetical protein HDU97_001488 [Phlyctochytrium planicorne]
MSRLLGIVAILLASLLGSVTAAPGIKRIVVYGDSMSDNGNSYALLSSLGTPKPAPPYYKGRFTNGPNYVDYFARLRRVLLKNYAFGGATTSDKVLKGFLGDYQSGNYVPMPGVDTQIVTYLKTRGSKIDRKKANSTLHIIWAGGNDERDNEIMGLGKTGDYYAKASYKNYQLLAKNGAKNILQILFAPLTPFEYQYSEETKKQVTLFKQNYPNIKIEYYDIVEVVAPVLQNMAAYGFEHGMSEACCPGCSSFSSSGTPAACPDPEKWILWDGLHLTTRAAELLAKGVDAFIAKTFGYAPDI